MGSDTYLGFESYEDLVLQFSDNRWTDTPVPPKDMPPAGDIIVAAYDTPSYEGYAFVLFRKGGALYEVNASHCSCYGLEGQWYPEETSVAALQIRKRFVDSGWDWEEPRAEGPYDAVIRRKIAGVA